MNTRTKSLRRFAFLTLIVLSLATFALGWGGPHITITEAALALLQDWQKALLGEELSRLGRQHCLIPDRVFEDKAEAKFAMMDSKPGVTYLVNLHLPASQSENLEVLRYFIAKAVGAFEQGRTADGARFAGTLAHALEDWGCPAHAVADDNMFTLFQQLLPPPEQFRDVLLHSPVESGNFKVSLTNYQPRLLGTGGNVEFEVMGNGARLASTGPLVGNAPAVRLTVPLAGITKLQLVAKSAGDDGNGNYAVWGAPRLVK